MKISIRLIYFRAMVISLLLMGSACSGGGSVAETPTLLPVPTGTPVVVPASLPTPVSTGTPLPTQQPVTMGTIAIDQESVNVRAAPSAVSDLAGTLKAGDDVQVLGILADRGWLEIAFPSAPGDVAWVFAGLVSVMAQDVPVVSADGSPAITPTLDTAAVSPKVVEAIRKFGQQTGVMIGYVGKTDFIAMGFGAEKTLDRYNLDGVNYDIDPLSNRIVAYHIDPASPAGAKTYLVDEIETMAREFVETQIPGIQLQSLIFEKGNKVDNYWFHWSQSSTGPGYSVCVQLGYTIYGQLFDYYDTLPADGAN